MPSCSFFRCAASTPDLPETAISRLSAARTPCAASPAKSNSPGVSIQIDLGAAPGKGGNSGANRYFALDFFWVKVTDGIALRSFSQSIAGACFKKQELLPMKFCGIAVYRSKQYFNPCCEILFHTVSPLSNQPHGTWSLFKYNNFIPDFQYK